MILTDTQKKIAEIKDKILQAGIKEDASNHEFIFRIAVAAASVGISKADFLNEVTKGTSDDSAIQAIESAYKYDQPATKISTAAKTKEPEIDAEAFLKQHYNFRMDVVRERTEFKSKNESEYRTLREYDINSIFRFLQRNKVNIGHKNLNFLLNSDFAHLYHPFEDYYTTLPKWDTTTDYIGQLVSTLETTAKDLLKKWLEKYLVNVVAATLDGKANHQMLVLYGAQGIGKTTWLNKLVPVSLKEYLYLGSIQPSSRDSIIHLTERMFINIDELENLNKTEINSLKSFITNPEVVMRKMYAKNHDRFIRRASFIASINTKGFLRDITGDRRYLCFEALSINFNHEVNMDMVYSQAYSLYQSGFQYEFNSEDQQDIRKNNEQFRELSIEEELILMYYKIPEGNDECFYMNATEIIGDLNSRLIDHKLKVDNASKMMVGRVMAAQGYQMSSKHGLKKYRVTKVHHSTQVEQTPPTPLFDMMDSEPDYQSFLQS